MELFVVSVGVGASLVAGFVPPGVRLHLILVKANSHTCVHVGLQSDMYQIDSTDKA